jgi:hypothetical protein
MGFVAGALLHLAGILLAALVLIGAGYFAFARWVLGR